MKDLLSVTYQQMHDVADHFTYNLLSLQFIPILQKSIINALKQKFAFSQGLCQN